MTDYQKKGKELSQLMRVGAHTTPFGTEINLNVLALCGTMTQYPIGCHSQNFTRGLKPMSEPPVKNCDYCDHVGRAYTWRGGETMCENCVGRWPTSGHECRKLIHKLEQQLQNSAPKSELESYQQTQSHLIGRVERLTQQLELSVPKSDLKVLSNYFDDVEGLDDIALKSRVNKLIQGDSDESNC